MIPTNGNSSFSFSYQISQNFLTQSLSFPHSNLLSSKFPTLIVASTATVENNGFEDTKSQLPGGFAAQNIINIGRRKAQLLKLFSKKVMENK